MGFGAERANLMGEEAVSMPTTADTGLNGVSDAGHEDAMLGDSNLALRANNAKT